MQPLSQESVTEEEYLEGELKSVIRHEYIDGQIYAMAGGSGDHNTISGNVLSELRTRLKGKSCHTFMSDMKVKVGRDYFYPDVVVDCSFDRSTPYFTDSPVVIVEVLSPSTRRTDKITKFSCYKNIPSLQEYVIIEQDFAYVEVMSRNRGWAATQYFMGDVVVFESIDVTIPVEEIYYMIENDDVIKYKK